MKIKVIFFLFGILLFIVTCTTTKSFRKDESELKIRLRWVQSYPEETPEKVEVGLKWILSYLGAMLPQSSISEAIYWCEEDIICLDISKAGFPEASKKIWSQLIKKYKSLEEYQLLGSLDIGRFVLLSFNNSWHYYAITGVAPDFESFEKQYNFANKKDYLLLGESCIASGIRTLLPSEGDNLNMLAHIAEEGIGSTIESFETKEFEVFDFMENGQPRFAIYDMNGKLISGVDPNLSKAGKPAKCMWCHESKILPPFALMKQNKDTLRSFKNLVKTQNIILNLYSESLNTQVDTFRNNKSQHFLAELLYITYQTPTLDRAKKELENVNQPIHKFAPPILSKTHHEFEYLTNLVNRIHLDALLPYPSTVDIDSRNTTTSKVNLLEESLNP